MTQQRDLGDPVCSEVLDLGHQFAEGSADLWAPHCRDDAEGTRIVTTDLDGDPGGVVGVSPGRQRRRERVGIIAHGLFEDLHYGAVPTGVGQQLGGTVDVVGAEHDIDMGCPFLYEFTVLLGETAGHGDLQARSLFLEGLEVAQGAVEPVVGVLPDAAGVEHDDVGVGL